MILVTDMTCIPSLKFTMTLLSFASVWYSLSTVIDDLDTVFNFLRDVADKWKFIGLQLHLSKPKLDKLAANMQGKDQNNHLLDMLDLWLQHNYCTEKFGKPTWRMLVNALNSVENGKPIAENILEEKPWK